jgi:hypothetical protein
MKLEQFYIFYDSIYERILLVPYSNTYLVRKYIKIFSWLSLSLIEDSFINQCCIYIKKSNEYVLPIRKSEKLK